MICGRVLALIILAVSVYGADHRFGGLADERHREMTKELHEEKEEEPSWWDRPYLTGD